MTISFIDNLEHIHHMNTHKNSDIPIHENIDTLSQDKIKQIEEKQVYSFKYTGQHGDIITSYWPTLEKAMKAKQELEDQGYDVSKILNK